MKARCKECGATFTTYPSRLKRGEGKYCSNDCANLIRGKSFEKNGNWKGGRYLLKDGYVGVCIGKGKYKREHVVIMEKHLGRKLHPWENVHHKNEDKTDNRLENLQLMDAAEHASHHHLGSRKTEYITCRCLGCGKTFERRKREVELHPNTYCDRDCYKKSANADSFGSVFGPRPGGRVGAPPPHAGRPSMRPSMPGHSRPRANTRDTSMPFIKRDKGMGRLRNG